MNDQPKVSVFLSSPADVAPEREAAERVVQRLNGVYAAHVELTAKRWERHFYEADRGFQEAIAPMGAFDIVVGILWKRIGSELPPDRFSRPNGTPYESGTVYEIETALAARRRSGRPSVYVFKSERPITYSAERVDMERAQKEALDRWWGCTFRDEAGRHIAATNSFGDTENFEVKLEDCLVGWLRERGHIPGGPVWDVEVQGSPYPGLVAYDPKYSPVFFGRHLAVEQAREELLGAAAREGGRPVLFVIGASGSGKSSLVRAGLVPRLTRPGVVPGVDLWRTVITVPATDSLGPLAAHLYAPDGLPELAASAQRDPERWARMAAGDPEAAADSLAWALDRIGEAERRCAQADRRIEARLLLVVDQLEGLFGTSGQEAFTKVVLALVGSRRVWLLTTLRSDRYADFQLDGNLLALKHDGATYDLPPPGSAEIADIVKGPARAADLTFADRDGRSLARVLVEAAPNADALPLLQMTLAQLFERREGAELTFAAYEAMGGVEGAIAAYADDVFARVPPAAQRELDPLFRALVRDVVRSRSDEQVRFTARDADRKAFEISEARKHLVEFLVEGRLLVSDGGKLRVAHEALLRRWERARSSLRRLADAELRKARLQRAMAMAAAFVFLAVAGIAVWQGLEAEQARESTQAELDRRLEAEMARLAQAARRETDEGRPELGIQVAVMALASQAEVRKPPPSRWRAIDALAWSISAAGPISLADMPHKGRISGAAFSPDGRKVITASTGNTARLWDARNGRELLVLQSKGTVVYIAFSPDGQRFFTASAYGSAQVWDANTGTQLTILHGEPNGFISKFSPDGRKVLTASTTGNARLLDLDNDGREFLVFRQGERVYSAEFSPDGQKIVTASVDGINRVWDAVTGAELAAFRTYEPAGTIAFSSDGRRILTAPNAFMTTKDYTARLWDAATGTELATLPHEGGVNVATFSPDGRTILTASVDNTMARIQQREAEAANMNIQEQMAASKFFGTAQLWDAATGRKLVVLRHEEAAVVTSAVFSPDGRKVLTVGGRTARLWDAGTGAELDILQHERGIDSATFTADGQRVLVSSDEENGTSTARLWEIGSGRELLIFQHEQPVKYVDYSRDGQKVLTTSGDHTARLWDTSSGRELLVLDQKSTVAFFSDDGKRVVTGSKDGSIRVWDAISGEELAVLRGHSGPVRSAIFSRNGRNIVSASEDRTARLWDVASGTEVAVLRHKDELFSAGFSPDGQKVFTLVHDDMIIDGKSLRTALAKNGIDLDLDLLKKGEYYQSKAYFETLQRAGIDINKLGAAKFGFVARLWDASDGRELLAVRHEHGIGSGGEFSPDGRKLLTTSSDGTSRLVDAASGAELAVLRGHEGHVGSGRFSPDGQRVITASDDHTARVWDAASGAELAVLRGNEGTVTYAQFSRDGQRAFTNDGTVRLWQLPAYHSEGELLAYAKALALPPPGMTKCREFGIVPEQCTWPLP